MITTSVVTKPDRGRGYPSTVPPAIICMTASITDFTPVCVFPWINSRLQFNGFFSPLAPPDDRYLKKFPILDIM